MRFLEAKPIKVPPNVGIPGRENHTHVRVLPYSGPGIFSFSVLKLLVVFCFRPAKLDYEPLFSSPDFSATVCPVHNSLLCLRNAIDFLFTFCLLKGQKQWHPNCSHVAEEGKDPVAVVTW